MRERKFGTARLGREVAAKLVEAMGLPLDGCSAVEVELPPDGFATVSVTYALTAEHVQLLADLMKREP